MTTKNNSTTPTDEFLNHMQKSHKNSSNDIRYEDVDFCDEKLKEDDRKAYVDLFTHIDIYKVVKGSPKDSDEQLKEKCTKLLAKLHPDKRKYLLEKFSKDERVRENKKLDIQYKMVRDAYEIFRNPERRKYYDSQKKVTDSKNFVKQKDSFEDFIKLQESEINEKSKSFAENNFKMLAMESDKKHNYDKELESAPKLGEATLKKKVLDLEMIRKQQECEYAPKKLFSENTPYNPITFNQFFEKHKKREERKNKSKNRDSSLVVWEGISAANDVGFDGANDFIPVNDDKNYGSLYIESNPESSLFASTLDSDDESVELSDISDENIDVSYVENHNKNRSEDAFKSMLEQREKERAEFDKTLEKFSEYKPVTDNPMNISSQMGRLIGTKTHGTIEYDKPKEKKITKDELEAYKKLIYDPNVF